MRLTPLALASLLVLAVPSALADDDDDGPARGGISQQQAVRIAQGYGMARVDQVEQDDDGWQVDGRDHRRRDLTVAMTWDGRVTKVDRGDSASSDDDDGDDDSD